MSCGAAVSTLLNINTGEAKRLAKIVISKEATEIDFEKLKISNDLKTYIVSNEGQSYFKNIRLKNGQLKSLKLESVVGSTSDTMNYRFRALFKAINEEKEVRVQAFKDQEIVNVLIGSWKDTMMPIDNTMP